MACTGEDASSLTIACRGVLQMTTDDGRRQTAKQYWRPTLCVSGQVIRKKCIALHNLLMNSSWC